MLVTVNLRRLFYPYTYQRRIRLIPLRFRCALFSCITSDSCLGLRLTRELPIIRVVREREVRFLLALEELLPMPMARKKTAKKTTKTKAAAKPKAARKTKRK